MSDYVQKKKDMRFQSQDALKTVQAVIDDADLALHEKSRKMKDSPIGEAVAGAVGVGVGAGIGFAGLYLGGSVVGLSAAGITSGLAAAGTLIGGGMAAGVAVLAAPAVVLGGTAMGVTLEVYSILSCIFLLIFASLQKSKRNLLKVKLP